MMTTCKDDCRKDHRYDFGIQSIMDHMEIVHLSLLLESADVLGAKVTEALEVLAQHAVVEAS